MIRGGGCRVIEFLQAPSIKFRVRAEKGRRDGNRHVRRTAIGTSSMDKPLGDGSVARRSSRGSFQSSPCHPCHLGPVKLRPLRIRYAPRVYGNATLKPGYQP